MNRKSREYLKLSPEERWFYCIERTPDGCWNWLGAPNASGYGALKIDGKTIPAHRFGFEMLVEKIPNGLQLDHLCRNRLCVNPEHLEIVTSRENTLRGNTIAAKEAKQTHCIHGHPLFGDNLRVDKAGKRVCRFCNSINGATWRIKNNIASDRDFERIESINSKTIES